MGVLFEKHFNEGIIRAYFAFGLWVGKWVTFGRSPEFGVLMLGALIWRRGGGDKAVLESASFYISLIIKNLYGLGRIAVVKSWTLVIWLLEKHS